MEGHLGLVAQRGDQDPDPLADMMTVRVEHEDRTAADDLADRLFRRIALTPVVEVVPPGSLNRFGGKANRVIDLH